MVKSKEHKRTTHSFPIPAVLRNGVGGLPCFSICKWFRHSQKIAYSSCYKLIWVLYIYQFTFVPFEIASFDGILSSLLLWSFNCSKWISCKTLPGISKRLLQLKSKTLREDKFPTSCGSFVMRFWRKLRLRHIDCQWRLEIHPRYVLGKLLQLRETRRQCA